MRVFFVPETKYHITKHMKTLKPAIWFSRHMPSQAQLSEAEEKGFFFPEISEGMALGARSIDDCDALRGVIAGISRLARQHSARAVFGVFPTPMLGSLNNTAQYAVLYGDWCPRDLTCYASWNISRTPEGGKPTFAHYKWVCVGALALAPILWHVHYSEGGNSPTAETTGDGTAVFHTQQEAVAFTKSYAGAWVGEPYQPANG